jgi:LysM repeat protein
MPVATIGLFALAIIVIAIAFLIQQAVGGDDGKLSTTDAFDTQQALKTQSPQATQGNQTKAPTGTPGTATASRTPGTPGTTTTTTTTQTPGTGGKTYTVKSGDNCSTIAEAQGVTLKALLDANKMTEDDCTRLDIGKELKIP